MQIHTTDILAGELHFDHGLGVLPHFQKRVEVQGQVPPEQAVVPADKTKAIVGASPPAEIDITDARFFIGQRVGPDIIMLDVVGLVAGAGGKADAIHREQATEIDEETLAVALAAH